MPTRKRITDDAVTPASFLNGLRYLRSITYKPRLEVQQIEMLLTLHAEGAAMPMQELARRLSTDVSFVSRNAKGFGVASKGRRLVALRIDEDNPRQRLIELTTDGRLLVGRAIGIIDGTEPMPTIRPIKDARAK